MIIGGVEISYAARKRSTLWRSTRKERQRNGTTAQPVEKKRKAREVRTNARKGNLPLQGRRRLKNTKKT